MVWLQATMRAMDDKRMLLLLKDEQEGVKSVEEFFGGVEVAVRRQKDLLLQELQMNSAGVTSSMDIQIRCVCMSSIHVYVFPPQLHVCVYCK